jgi:hypothetical protein
VAKDGHLSAVMRRLIFVSFFVLMPYTAVAQISGGTLIVFGISRDKAVIAGDSRGLIKGRPPIDHKCKITALGTRLLFTESGTAEDIHTVDVSKNWSSAREASRAFETFQKSNAGTDPIDQVSSIWLISMEKMYSELLRTMQQEILAHPGNKLITSVFVGLDAGGHIEARRIVIRFDRAAEESGTPKLSVDNKLWDVTNDMDFKAIGHTEISDEFVFKTSERAKIDAQHFALELRNHRGEDLDALIAIHLVDVSETYAPADFGIGGPIDVAEIFPNTGVQCIHRKPECPAEGVN